MSIVLKGGVSMKLLLISFFNSTNIGDIMIGEKLGEIAENFFEVEKLSYTDSYNYDDININQTARTKVILSLIRKNIEKIGFRKFVYYFRWQFRKPDISRMYDRISNAELLVIGGGNMIFDLSENSFSANMFDAVVRIAKKKNKKIFAISLGIGPFQNKEQEYYAVKALSKCDYITFRDQTSYDIFIKYNKKHKNVFVSIDPVFLTPQLTNVEKIPKYIALNIINRKLIADSDDQYQNLIMDYALLTDELVKKFAHRIVLFTTEFADQQAVDDVYQFVENKNMVDIRTINNANSLIDLYQDTLVLIGTRMHSMIVAHTQLVPIIGLSWQQKVVALFEIIDSKDALFSYDGIQDDLERIIECTEHKLKNLEKERNRIKNNINNIKKRNDINLEILTILKYRK